LRSSALVVAAAVGLAPASVASAQSAPAEDPAGPVEANELDEPVDDPTGPTDDSGAPPDDAAPARPRASDTMVRPSRPAKRGGTLVVIGVELGVGGVLSGGSEVHGAGLGRGFVIGARRGRASIEWHLGGLYDAPIDEELEAANTAGELGMSSLGVRIAPSPALSLYGGMARASVPLLVRGADSSVHGATLDGIGPIAGVAVGWSNGGLRLGVELRLARMLITDAMPEHVAVTGPTGADGMIPVSSDRRDLHPLIGTLNATIQFEE